MTPLLVLLLAGVAWGETSTLEFRDHELVEPVRPGYALVQPINLNPYAPGPYVAPEDKLTYVVEVTSVCVKSSGYVLTSNPPIIPCEKWESQYAVAGIGFWSKDQADDMAEALNQAHRRRVK